MRLKFVETLIDSIDPYYLVKDMGFQLLDEQTDKRLTNAEKENLVPNDFYGCMIRGQILRIMPYGFLNISALSHKKADTFIAGTGIDLLAFYMKGDYSKAFTLFFKHYRTMLQSKIKHEPAYIEKLIKPAFVKRHVILQFIVGKLFEAAQTKSNLTICHAWANKKGIENTQNTIFYAESSELEKILKFIADPATFDIKDVETDLSSDINHIYTDFMSKHLFKDSDQWIVVPYFGDYHYVNSLKIINPATEEEFTLQIANSRLGYAGLYNLSPKINFLSKKIRLFADNIGEMLTMASYQQKMLNNDVLSYLSVHNENAGVSNKSSVSSFHKPIFLHTEKCEDYQVIKAVYDNLNTKNTETSDLFICEYKNYQESAVVRRFETFLIDEFKKLANLSVKSGSTGFSVELGYFLGIYDINSLKIKQQIMQWLLDMQYVNLYARLNQKAPDVHDFKTYTITATENGYLCHSKNDMSGANDIALTNFIIKIDQSIVFPDTDDILHQGRIISGNTLEYPVAFYKSEIRHHNTAIETISLKAFTALNSHMSALDDEISVTMPIIFDPSYNSALFTILNHEISHAPIKYGSVNVGWDKSNNKFTSLSWQAHSMNYVMRKQHIYTLTTNSKNGVTRDIQNCYSNLPMACLDYGQNYEFLNKSTKDILSLLLASLYRTYLGYNVVPFKVNDTVNARNLIKFIYAALGQIHPYEVTPNTRVLRQNRMFQALNRYPIYVRTTNPSGLLKYCNDYPYIVFLKKSDVEDEDSLYTVTQALSRDGYKQLTKFTLDTLARFFKWMFMLHVEELDLEKQECETQEQLIEEGNAIFAHLWWDKVQEECKKDIAGIPALKECLSLMTLKQFYQYCYYFADSDRYVLRAITMPTYILDAVFTAKRVLRREKRCKNDAYYLYIEKDTFEEAMQGLILSDNTVPDVSRMKIFLPKAIERSPDEPQGQLHKRKRTVSREEYKQLLLS
jgi:hypothetical protein